MRWFAILTAITAAGCGAAVRPTCKVPDVIELQLEASDRVNSDEAGRSLPTLLRIYQLAEVTSLEQSSFEDVWQGAAATLGADLLGADEITIYPGQKLSRRVDRNPEANYVVSMAVFRQPAGSVWRAVVELPRPGDPCAETGREPTQPPTATLPISVLLEDYRVEAVAGFVAPLRGRQCDPTKGPCDQTPGTSAEEIRLVGHDGRVQGGTRRPRLPTATPAQTAPTPEENAELPTRAPNVPNPPRVPQGPAAPSVPSAPSAPNSSF